MDADKLLSRVGDAFTVGRAFGEPVEREGVLVIPVAWVAGGGGGGGQETTEAAPGGSGGGFGGVTWPLGVYEVKDGSVRWVPALDVTRIVLGALFLACAVVKLRARSHRRPSRA